MKDNFKMKYYPDEIAETLCSLAFDKLNKDIINDCTEALYQLKTIAENSYNANYYRTLYKVLEKIKEVTENGSKPL